MKKEELERRTKVQQAYLDGEEIEYKANGDEYYYENDNPIFNWEDYDYRIKQEPTREEVTAKWVKDNDLKIGDMVEVVKKMEDCFIDEMDDTIGEIGIVMSIGSDDIKVAVNGESWFYWVESLEKVTKKYEPYTFEDTPELIGKAIRSKDKGVIGIIGYIDNLVNIFMGGRFFTFNYMFENYEYLDGTPFGKEIN